MSPLAQQVAIAKAIGTHDVQIGQRPHLKIPIYRLTDKNGLTGDLWENGSSTSIGFVWPPDFLRDLNAMAEAEKVLNEEQLSVYGQHLLIATKNWKPYWGATRVAFATAAQRSEAFLKTLGKWTP